MPPMPTSMKTRRPHLSMKSAVKVLPMREIETQIERSSNGVEPLRPRFVKIMTA